MPNFVVIEKDERLVRELTTFIKELDEENRVRSFPTIVEFEENYFQNQVTGIKSLREHPLLKGYTEEQFLWLIDKGVNWKKKPPGGQKFRIHVFFEGWTVVKTEPVTDQFLTQKINPKLKPKFEPSQFIVPEFKSVWDDNLKKFESGDDVEFIIPMRTMESDEPWMFRFRLHLDGMEIHIDVENVSQTLKMLIEKEKPQEEGEGALGIFSVIDLVLFQYDRADKNVSAWAKDTLLKLKKGNFCPEAQLTKLVAMKWESDHHEIQQFFSPYIEEVLFFPLDRLLFLQKLDTLMGLPKNPKPRFLFEQDVKYEIEISKKATITSMNDYGFTIQNPIPMKPGIMGHFYFSLPGQKEVLKVFGRSVDSQKNPAEPGTYLVQFDYFGIDKHTLSMVRHYLKDSRQFKPLIDQDAKKFEFNPDDMFLTEEQKRRRYVMIIDADQERAQTVKELIKQDFGQTVVYHEPSYLSFLYKYLKNTDTDLSKVPLLETKDVTGGGFAVEISRYTGGSVHEAPKKKDKGKDKEEEVALPVILDWTPDLLFAAPDQWKKLLASKKEEEILAELIKSVTANKRIHSSVRVKLQNGDLRLASLELHGLPSGNINLTFAAPTMEQVSTALAPQDLKRLDLMLVSSNMVPTEAATWVQNLTAELKGRSLISGESIPIVLIENDGTIPQVPAHLVQGDFYSYIKAPIDRRLMACTIAKATDNPFTVYKPNNLGLVPTKATAYLARPGKLLKISEFGCKLHMPQKLSVGTILYFHGSFFDAAKNEPVCGRLYHIEEDPSEKATFICSFFYFGITDSFLKFTRSWIRENYAHSKQKEG